MTAKEHYIADISDIIAMRIVCKACKTAISVDPVKWQVTPSVCPNCRATLFLENRAGEPVDLFRIALRTWKEQAESSRYDLELALVPPQ